MRVLVVSDIHANPAALAAIRDPFDACVCLGDLVEYGPDPGPCLDWVRRNAVACVRGNHDHGAAQNVETVGASGFRYLTMCTRKTTAARLGPADRAYLGSLPTSKMLRFGRHTFLLVHATPRDPMDEYAPPDPAAWAQQLAGVTADFVLVGHTHAPMTLAVGKTTVVNPGSVGLPRDGNPRARYAVIDDGVVTLKDVAYDVAETLAGVAASGLEPLAKQMLADVYTHGRYVHPPGRPLPRGGNGAANGNSHGANGNGHAAGVGAKS